MATTNGKEAKKEAKPDITELAQKSTTPKSTSINAEELIREFEQEQLKKDLPEIKSGSTVAVHQLVAEKGGKTRTQIFEGVVLRATQQKKLGATILVRKIASGVGVERTFFLHSPLIEKVEVKKVAKTRRSKLYYLRHLTGKAAQQKEVQDKETVQVASKSSEAKPAANNSAATAKA